MGREDQGGINDHSFVSKSDNGVDKPPPVAGQSNRIITCSDGPNDWSELPLKQESMQRMCTFEGGGINPEIIFKKYIVGVNYHGELFLLEAQPNWMNQKHLHQLAEPKAKCDAGSKRITCFTSVDIRYDNSASDLDGYVVLADDDGRIFLISVSPSGNLQPVFSFSRGLINTTMMTCWFDVEGSIHIVIATRGGMVQEWCISDANSTSNWGGSGTVKPKLLWQGSFNCILFSILAVRCDNNQHFLSACTSQQSSVTKEPHSSIELLDPVQLAEAYSKEALQLSKFCLWPSREWNVATDDMKLLNVANGGPSYGSDILCQVKDNTWVAALSDGRVGLFHVVSDDEQHTDESKSQKPQWTFLWHILLSFPAVSLGVVQKDNTTYVVCGLRSGTVYLVPLLTSAGSIPVYTLPIEHGDDQLEDITHLQGLASGTIRAPDGSDIPVLLFCGPAGLTYVYACSPMEQRFPEAAEKVFLFELAQNGTIQLLLDSVLGTVAGGTKGSVDEEDETTNENDGSEIVVSLQQASDDEFLLVDEVVSEEEVDTKATNDGSVDQSSLADFFQAVRNECGDDTTVEAVLANTGGQYNETRKFLLDLGKQT